MTADSDSGPKPGDPGVCRGVVVVSDGRQDPPAARDLDSRAAAVPDLQLDRWAGLMRRVMAEEGVAIPWEAGLSFVAADEMAALNAAHRGIDRPTDVLAFGADDGSAPRAGDEPRLVGDVVICPSVAASDAEARDKAFDEELALLVVHGTLHLLGYDHIDDVDARKMEERERVLLALDAATAARAGPQAEPR